MFSSLLSDAHGSIGIRCPHSSWTAAPAPARRSSNSRARWRTLKVKDRCRKLAEAMYQPRMHRHPPLPSPHPTSHAVPCCVQPRGQRRCHPRLLRPGRHASQRVRHGLAGLQSPAGGLDVRQDGTQRVGHLGAPGVSGRGGLRAPRASPDVFELTGVLLSGAHLSLSDVAVLERWVSSTSASP